MFLLSDRARQDLDDIRRYTIEVWGREQWLKYYRGLVEGFEQIADRPMSGRDRSLFVPGTRSLNCQKHVVFFMLSEAEAAPVILRIVHQRRYMPALVYYKDMDGG